uniref:RagB/SusD family nutrient uptake outer membrane protein n=1 Tax=Roseihalotalea indica TaxID=2867963 RepID=A0AA49JFF1_9BACT|nr:RagB/SusD family nutrient uptake outer membrane protein [Tunicatimonas sp. TK19036]
MKIRKNICALLSVLMIYGCSDVLDLEPKDKLSGQALFSDPAGVKIYMANLYYQLPVEDFAYFRNGYRINSGDPNNGGFAPAMHTDEAVHSEFGDFIGDGDFNWWEQNYKLIRDVNLLIDIIPTLDISEEDRRMIQGEAAFIRAYTYFELAKLYGGVPLILSAQAYDGEVESLKVPRSTEEDTWNFIMDECDVAIANLPESWAGGERRGTKWAAYALKSRAALHAASVAKFGDRAPLSGNAVDQQLIGLNANLANDYYAACIEASEAIMNSGMFGLYKPNPANPEEAAENYRELFQDPNIAPTEAIFIKGFARPGNETGHNYNIWFQPAQTANGWPHPGRMNPTLDFIDIYESYDNPGENAPIVTTQSGDLEDYNGFDASNNYLHFDNPYEIFEGKDARLWGTVILPGTEWKDQKIIIQAGYVKPEGDAVIRTSDQVTIGETVYYSYGGPNPSTYSGFDPFGGNNTRTGFSFKKFLDERIPVTPGWNQSTTDFIDFRYAEILLNYAEAVLESGLGDASRAEQAMNETRRRAAHTEAIPLTIENLMRERRVELAFENKRYWDLIRRREYHTVFDQRRLHSLFPLLDLRLEPPQYIFVRAFTPNLNPRNFDYKWYYRPIPGIGANGLTQNPQY